MEVNSDPSTAVCVLTPCVSCSLICNPRAATHAPRSVFCVQFFMTCVLCGSNLERMPSEFETDNSLDPRSVPWRAVYSVHSTQLELLQG